MGIRKQAKVAWRTTGSVFSLNQNANTAKALRAKTALKDIVRNLDTDNNGRISKAEAGQYESVFSGVADEFGLGIAMETVADAISGSMTIKGVADYLCYELNELSFYVSSYDTYCVDNYNLIAGLFGG